MYLQWSKSEKISNWMNSIHVRKPLQTDKSTHDRELLHLHNVVILNYDFKGYWDKVNQIIQIFVWGSVSDIQQQSEAKTILPSIVEQLVER